MHLCPMDLAKLHEALAFDIVTRERALAELWLANGLDGDAHFSQRLVGALTGEHVPEATAPTPGSATVPAAAPAPTSAPAPAPAQPTTAAELSQPPPAVARQPSGMCSVCADESDGSDRAMKALALAPPALGRLPSHDKGLLKAAYG